jgi:hypothetical protein
MASPDLAADFRALFDDMAVAWRAAPAPEGVAVTDLTRAALAEISAVAVTYGWMARVVRTGEAALLLADDGYATEAAPLVRTMIEHAIGLWWLVEERGTAFQVLVRARSRTMQRFQEAQETGWTLEGPESQQLLQDAIDLETDQATVTRDFMQHVKNQAVAYGLGSLYQAWLIETGYSHASLSSAQPYYNEEEAVDGGTIHLLPVPIDPGHETDARVVSITHTALIAYNRLLPGEPLTEQLEQWERRFADLGTRLTQEIAAARSSDTSE